MADLTLVTRRRAVLHARYLAFRLSRLGLLPEFGLARLTVMLLFVGERSNTGCIASAIFYTLPPHLLAAQQSRRLMDQDQRLCLFPKRRK